MRKTINISLQDLLHAINILGYDRDVTVDGIGSIAVCPPARLTPEGHRQFAQALKANVNVEYENDSHWDTYVSGPDEKTEKIAWSLLISLAGYCPADDYDRWFESEQAEII